MIPKQYSLWYPYDNIRSDRTWSSFVGVMDRSCHYLIFHLWIIFLNLSSTPWSSSFETILVSINDDKLPRGTCMRWVHLAPVSHQDDMTCFWHLYRAPNASSQAATANSTHDEVHCIILRPRYCMMILVEEILLILRIWHTLCSFVLCWTILDWNRTKNTIKMSDPQGFLEMFYTGTISIDSMPIYQIGKYGWENGFQRHSAIMYLARSNLN